MTIKELHDTVKQHVKEHPNNATEILIKTPNGSYYEVYDIDKIIFNEEENVLEIKTKR